MRRATLLLSWLCCGVFAQEAPSGAELSATVSGLAVYSHQLSAEPRDGAPLAGGFRAVLYPAWKLSDHWTISGAVQLYSRPYFFDQLSTQGYEVKADVLQLNLSYSRFWTNRSLVVRAGQLSSAFGSFLLRYDDAVNPLIDKPMSYGYYYGVSNLGLTGAQVDVTLGKLDARAQFVSSSPLNRRGVFDRDQHGNWAGGPGYTLKQGFRVGISALRGPYLDHSYSGYLPEMVKLADLPASAVGIDAQWGRGPWNAYGEWQRFQFDYYGTPTFIRQVGYGEVRRTLHPRWYVATRVGYSRSSAFAGRQAYEMVVGYRPNRFQLVKAGYQIEQRPGIRGTLANTLAVQFVTTLGPLSVARD